MFSKWYIIWVLVITLSLSMVKCVPAPDGESGENDGNDNISASTSTEKPNDGGGDFLEETIQKVDNKTDKEGINPIDNNGTLKMKKKRGSEVDEDNEEEVTKQKNGKKQDDENLEKKKKPTKNADEGDDDDQETKKPAKETKKKSKKEDEDDEKPAKKKKIEKEDETDEDAEEEEKPQKKKKPKKKNEDDEENDEKPAKMKKTKKVKEEKEEEEEEEEEKPKKKKKKGKKKVDFAEQCQLDQSDFKPKKIETEEDVTSISTDTVGSQLQAAFNWQSLLTPAPHVLCLLGQINVLGSHKDFPMTNSNKSLKFMKYPNSFRATLMQLGNEGLEAFQLAHKNMGEMSHYLVQIPGKIREAIRMLDQGFKKSVMGKRLKIPLKSISTFTDSCLNLTAATEAKFMNVQSLLLEILEISQLKRGQEEKREKEIQAELNAMKKQKELFEQLKQQAAEDRVKAEKRLNESEQAYKDAVKKIPSSWEVLAQEVVKTTAKGLADAATAFAGSYGQMRTMITGGIVGIAGSALGGQQQMEATQQAMAVQGQQSGLLAIPNQMQKCEKLVNSFLTEIKKRQEKVSLDEGGLDMEDISTAAGSLSGPISSIDSSVNDAQVPPGAQDYKTKAAEAIGKVTELMKAFEEIKDAAEPEKVVDEKKSDLSTTLDEIKALISQGSKMAGQAQAGAKADAPTGPSQKPQTVEQEAAEMELRRLQLNQQQQNQATQELKTLMQNLTAISSKIEGLDMNKIELGEIIEILKEALKYLEILKEQWSKLLQFFSMLASDTKALLGTNVNEFLEHMDTANEGVDAFFKTEMKCKEFTILKISNHLYIMSSTYSTVSNLFLMPRISSVTSLLNAADDTERKTLIKELKTNATLAEKQIEEIADAQQKKYQDFIQKSIQDAQKQIEDLSAKEDDDK